MHFTVMKGLIWAFEHVLWVGALKSEAAAMGLLMKHKGQREKTKKNSSTGVA